MDRLTESTGVEFFLCNDFESFNLCDVLFFSLCEFSLVII